MARSATGARTTRWATLLAYICQRVVGQIGLPTPPPADPLNTVRTWVSGEPSEDHIALVRRLLAEPDGEGVIALLIGTRLDEERKAKAAADSCDSSSGPPANAGISSRCRLRPATGA